MIGIEPIFWVRPWPWLRPIGRGIPYEEWWKWSENNLRPELYPKPAPEIPWYENKWWPWNWFDHPPEPPHIEPPDGEYGRKYPPGCA